MRFNVYETESCVELVLTASLEVIAKIFNMHETGVDRIVRERKSGAPFSTVHFNGRRNALGFDKIVLVAVEADSIRFDAAPEAKDPEACPGCGCKPGDGLTDGCEHPEGCGYFRSMRESTN